jgi:hypothetical protein
MEGKILGIVSDCRLIAEIHSIQYLYKALANLIRSVFTSQYSMS